MMTAQDWLDLTLRHSAEVLAILGFRCVPFVGYALGSPRVGWRAKALVAALFAGLTWLCEHWGVPAEAFALCTPLAFAYFGGLTLLVHWLRERVARGQISGLGLLCLLAQAFVLVPALLVPSAIVVPSLMVGWEIALSAYSYCVDTKTAERRPTLGDCAFFLLVNPVLVYAERGRYVGEPWLQARAALRALAGLSAMFASFALDEIFAALRPALAPASDYFASSYHWLAVTLAAYAAHSGLASLQIGFMGLLGHRVPERYHYPLLALGPLDFWRRWNIWLGAWARRYIYFPLATGLARTGGRRSTAPAKAAALLGCFLALGLFHDFFIFMAGLHTARATLVPLSATYVFTIFAAAALLWLALARLRWVIPRRLRPPTADAPPWARALRRALFWQYALLIAWLALPRPATSTTATSAQQAAFVRGTEQR